MDILIFLERSVCEIQSLSYESEHASQPPSNNLCAYTRNSKTTGHVWTFYVLNDCSTIGDVYFMLELDARYNSRLLTSNMHCSLFRIIHLSVYLHT